MMTGSKITLGIPWGAFTVLEALSYAVYRCFVITSLLFTVYKPPTARKLCHDHPYESSLINSIYW